MARTHERRRSTKLAKAMSDVTTVDWEDMDTIKGMVFHAKVFAHGVRDVAGKWARVQSVKKASGAQRAPRFVVLCFETKEAARDGSKVPCLAEHDLTLSQLQGHAGVGREDDGDSPSDDSAEDGEAEAEAVGEVGRAKSPAATTPAKGAAKKKARAAKKGALREEQGALRGVLAAAGLSKADVVARMLAAGVETVEEFESLAGAGLESLPDMVAAAGLAPLEKAALGKYMQVAPRASRLQDAYMGDDASEDDEDADSDGGDEAPAAPAKAAKAGGAGKGKYPRLGRMLAGVPKGRKEEVALDVLQGMCDALNKAPTGRELKQVMASAEGKLKGMGFTDEQLTPASPGGVEEVSALVTELGTAWEKPQQAGGARGGGAEGQVATVATGRQEPGMAAALAQVVSRPGLVEMIEKVMLAGDAAKTVQELSKAGEDEAFAALAHKAGDLAVPQGVCQTHTVLSVVHGLGRLRQVRAEYVAGQLREGAYLPAGTDVLAVAWKLVAGDLGEIDLAGVYKGGSTSSMLGSLGGGSAAPPGDSTSDAMLVVMRGLAMLLRGYCVAHPFDDTVATTFTNLQAEVVCAVQQGVHVTEAWNTLVGPFFREVGRKWKEVGRLAGARPRLGLVAEEQLATQAMRKLRERAASCTPVAQVSAADVRKLRSDLEASKAMVADLRRQLAAKGGAGGAGERGSGGVTPNMVTWQAGNPGKCYFWSNHQFCKFGAGCKNSTQPGHPQEVSKST